MHSIFFAQLIGWYLFITSLAMLTNQAHFKKVWLDTTSTPSITTLWSAISIVFGLVILLTHWVWVSDWPVLITIFGCFILFNAVVRFFLPEKAPKFYKDLQAKLGFNLLCWFWLLIGLYLVWMGHTQVC